jgi:hypothetical protein
MDGNNKNNFRLDPLPPVQVSSVRLIIAGNVKRLFESCVRSCAGLVVCLALLRGTFRGTFVAVPMAIDLCSTLCLWNIVLMYAIG